VKTRGFCRHHVRPWVSPKERSLQRLRPTVVEMTPEREEQSRRRREWYNAQDWSDVEWSQDHMRWAPPGTDDSRPGAGGNYPDPWLDEWNPAPERRPMDLELEKIRARYTELTGTNYSQEFFEDLFEVASSSILDLIRQHTCQDCEPSDASGDA
jgi:hypothetical protein